MNSTAGAEVTNSELIVKILSGLGPEFRGISASIRLVTPLLLMKNSQKAMKTLRRLPTRLLLQLLLPPSLVIPTLGTIVAPTMELAAINNGSPTIVFLHPISVTLRSPPILMMVFIANCETNRVMLQVFVDQNLTIILTQRPTIFKACSHLKLPGLLTMMHLIISLLTFTTCKLTMAWTRSHLTSSIGSSTCKTCKFCFI